MIMSFWPMSLQVEKNKKKMVLSECKAEQGQKKSRKRREEEECLQSKTKGVQTKCIPFRKQDNRKKGKKRSRNGGGHLCCH